MPARPDDQPHRDGPLSRAERQRRTRAALIGSARRTFAAEGFHGASLDTIAYDAGLSKGAVYSNFRSKADLFLGVMDADLAAIEPDAGTPVERFDPAGVDASDADEASRSDADEVGRGFALATLEFSAVAGRDPELAAALGQRIRGLADGFRPLVERHRADDETLDVEELAAMLIAYEQGAALLTIAGGPRIGADRILRGFRRLLTPAEDEDLEQARGR